MTKKTNRFWEIDFLRGFAVVCMIFFHFFYDLNFFNIWTSKFYSSYSNIIAGMIGSLFLLIVGISLVLSYSRAKEKLTKSQLQKKYIVRGLKIFGLGMLITGATWIYLEGE